jgi:hypothetical protein
MTTPRLAITTAVLEPTSELIQRCLKSQHDLVTSPAVEFCTRVNDAADNLGVTGSLQCCYEKTIAPVIAFIHSDVEIFEQAWDQRVLHEFDDPSVGAIGFGGALQLGEDDIYKTPYRLTQLRRIDYRSNTRDAETHGKRFPGECDVATLDGFALVVCRTLLDKLGGWPVSRYPFHSYDNSICMQAHRLGYRVRLVGIDCLHHGGATSTSPAAQAHWQSQGTTDAAIHEQSHKYLYEDGRGVLPWRAR